MPWSDAEIASVELVGDTDLGRGRRMERGHDGKHESRWGHMADAGRPRGASGGGTTNGGVCFGAEARSAMSEQTTRAGVARAWSKTSRRLIRGPSRRTDDL